MKIVFVRLFSISDEVISPLHFGYLASSLSKGHDVMIFDQLRDKLSEELLIKSIIKEQPYILGFSANSRDIFYTKKMMSKIKPLLPNTKIVLGGVQMTLMPCESYEYLNGCIDYGFAGESELGFSRFIERLAGGIGEDDLDEIPNLIWKKGTEFKINAKTFIDNLDEIPFPDWELMPPACYPKSPHGAFYKQYPYAPLITTRGCPYLCTFCSSASLSGRKVRYRSVDNVIEEIRYLRKNFGVKEIHIEDDNFSINKERVINFSEQLLKENLGITWAFPNGIRLDGLDLKVLRLMRKAGCYAICVGVESGNEERLRKIRKGITKEKIRDGIAMAKKAGLDVGGFFIIGFPGETLKEMNDTINFAVELKLDRIGISYFQPYPGSEEYYKLYDAGEYRFDFDKSRHSLHTISYTPDDVTEKQLKRLRFKGFIKFYFRPKIIIKLIKEIKSFEHFKFILKRILRWLSN